MEKFEKILVLTLAAVVSLAPAFAQNDPRQAPPPGYPAQQSYPPPQQPGYPAQPGYPQQPGYPAQQPYPPQPGYPSAYPPPNAPPPAFYPQQLDQMVGSIALYPDPLLAQVLTAATFWDQIPDASGWARAHAYLKGDALVRSIQEDRLPWDPSVIALLPFPSVLDLMAGNMGWTQQLGSAVLADRGAVMDAVQRQRSVALSYGYLRDNPYIRVVSAGPGNIQIVPVNPAYVYVPYYNPYVVFTRPRPGFAIAGAITFGPGIFVSSFAPWGWGHVNFLWPSHGIIVNNRPFVRTWRDRVEVVPRGRAEGPRVEHHELRPYREPEHRAPERRGERRDDHRDDRR